ncbi:hypothetical protein DMB65_20935 [Flavobacterium cheongpyeongense]|jgi:hypothetical protein|uniref:Uncharacterized protein n=1 Tax=Flavobacterium cheongpyeongense TaxID=2212651 RepID=A0A2V4BJC7_9FLAO|nr:hypothetical protein [Flavobacterium cheongpyeongense]PXY38847.1 hypothetical protein DMB65_20935 [Flavobacterium cheongpyeongense]
MENQLRKNRPSFKAVVDAFHENKVISSNITLKDLASVSDKLTSTLGVDDLASWTFIGPNFVYTGSDDIASPEVIIRSSKV